MADYLVKRSYGFMWHFCHNSSGICFCSMTNSHITEYEVLLPGGQSDFDVQIDDSDTAHLVCQDSGGNIIYIKTRIRCGRSLRCSKQDGLGISEKF